MLRRLGEFFLDIIQVIVFAMAIFLFVYLLILQPHKIKGASMSPNYPDGEYLLTDKVTYRFKEPSRGDIIVFKAPTGNGEEFIKRIIGLPGERISIKNGTIYINNQKLEEPYITKDIKTNGGAFLPEGEEVVVPEGKYFVVGDNRLHSSDSRIWGFVPKEKITGRAWLIYWPLNKAGLVEKIQYNL
jgi:signal peptidase I